MTYIFDFLSLILKTVFDFLRNTFSTDFSFKIFEPFIASPWNLAPESIKNCVTLWSVKNQIKEFVKLLPI